MTVDESCDDPRHEHLDGEINTVKRCVCGGEMIIRDPRTLDDGSVFAYDPFCGVTYFVRLV